MFPKTSHRISGEGDHCLIADTWQPMMLSRKMLKTPPTPTHIPTLTDGLTHWGRHKMAAIFHTTFSNFPILRHCDNYIYLMTYLCLYRYIIFLKFPRHLAKSATALSVCMYIRMSKIFLSGKRGVVAMLSCRSFLWFRTNGTVDIVLRW